MTQLKKFNQTPIANNYSVNLGKRNMNYDAATAEVPFKLLASGVSEILAFKKSKNERVAVELRDLKGNFKFAGIVEYQQETEDSDTGNWIESFTFNEEDVEDITTRYSITDNDCTTIIVNDGYDRYGMMFSLPTYVFDILEEAVDTLIEYLDLNAVADDTVAVEVTGAFVASVEFEDGIKCMSIVPDEMMKQIVKSDKSV